jgi:hypothetical protein
MAERVSVIGDFADSRHVVWAGLLNGDTGAPIGFQGSGDKSIQFTGTFGVGGSISLQGTCDKIPGSNWFVLNDLQTLAITKTAAALEGVAEAVMWVRPIVTAGDGTTNLTATMVVRDK